MRKNLLTLLTTLLCSVTVWGATAGTPVSIFSTDFSSATAHAYAVSTAENITGAAAGNFDYIASASKGNCGIAINSSSGGNSVDATGKFQVYANNTSYYWSAVENTNFESDRTGGAPTALKIVISDVYYNCISSGSNIGVNFAIGQGFSNTYASSSAPSGVFHSGFSIPSNSTLKFNQFNTTTALVSTAITLNGSTTITWFINNTGASLTYTGPDGKSYDLPDDKFALWTNTTKIVTEASATTGTKTLTNLYIGSTSGKRHTIYFSGINVYDISPDAGGGCSAPTSPSISGTTAYTAGNDISLTASATGTSASTTYTWYKGADWATASASSPVQATSTSGATFTKASCSMSDAGTYWCNISNGTGCDVQVSQAITVSCKNPTQTFSNSDYTVGGAALNLASKFSSNSSGVVTYSVQNAGGTGASIAGTSFSATTEGTAIVRASQAANGDYCAKTIDASVSVTADDCTDPNLTITLN